MTKTIISAMTMVITTCLIAACGGGENSGKIESLPIDAEMTLGGLSGPVDVVTDTRGMPHIYAGSDHDVLEVEGYLMARDRMAQLEFFRRGLQGTMTEIISPVLSPSLLDQDIGARQLGFHRMAKAIRASLADDDPTLLSMQAFSDGINHYIAELKAGTADLPGGMGGILPVDKMADWTPTDTLCIARYMTYDLSKTASEEVSLTAARLAVVDEFPSDSQDPALAARAGMLHDLWPFEPAEKVFSRDGFPNLDSDSGSRAFWEPRKPLSDPRPAKLPSRGVLQRALDYYSWLERYLPAYKGLGGGSNNWAVSGSKTESGNPMVMSDPHLSLQSPNFFWYAHLNTKRAGGDLNVAGLGLFGTPGILLGYNDNIGWGLTVANFDVEDVYQETITPGAGGNPDTVLFNGQQVPIQKIEEQLNIMGADSQTVEIEVVPHHGTIIPGTHQPGGTEALSRRWVGFEISNELKAVWGMNKAATVDEVEQALDDFEAGAQNWMVALSNGDIFWTTQSRIPIRDPRALTYDPATGTGYAPCFVLPGTGEYEWTGEDLSDRYIPHDLNPAKGYMSTANQDEVGVTADGDPFNDAYYIGWDFDLGHRNARVDSVLSELTSRGGVTRDEMAGLQGDDRSPLGVGLAPVMTAAVERAKEEHATPGTHADLTAVVTEIGADFDDIAAMGDRLAAWDGMHTPAAVEGTPSADEIADSVATTIFNASITRLLHLALDDEIARLGERPVDRIAAKTIEWAMLEPTKLNTYDAALGDTVLWDDLDTLNVSESRDERILRAMLGAHDFLTGKLGTDMQGWLWGKLHTVRFADISGLFGETFSIPPDGDQQFPDGFPRHGDSFGVDASNFGLWSTNDFQYHSGPQQRAVIEMTPDGPKVSNARPGGQAMDPADPHHADDAELWRKNEAPPLFFKEAEVVQNAERRVRFVP
ncbi:MAG TPA: penicillin acylase family protein [Myxococcota bacterium]|nr:penicillin acylase family protein [Myxococcota bacterium]